MKLQDYIKGLPLGTRIQIKLGGLWDRLLIKLGLCPHDSSFGRVGDIVHTCQCGKLVRNDDYEEERKALKENPDLLTPSTK